MDDRQLYQAILGLTAPWQVERVELRKDAQEVDVHVRWPEKTAGECPECQANCPLHERLFAALAASGHLPVQDDSERASAAHRLSDAGSQTDARALGGSAFAIH